MGLVALSIDLLTLKPVRESHQRWGTFLPNFGTLGLIEFSNIRYVRDGRTDGQKQRLIAPSLLAAA